MPPGMVPTPVPGFPPVPPPPAPLPGSVMTPVLPLPGSPGTAVGVARAVSIGVLDGDAAGDAVGAPAEAAHAAMVRTKAGMRSARLRRFVRLGMAARRRSDASGS